eukprot:m.131918 g.131918  ORF g.131918 m.131918 type:complete len:370 (-) comp17485_c0_seq4:442-1551(-)
MEKYYRRFPLFSLLISVSCTGLASTAIAASTVRAPNVTNTTTLATTTAQTETMYLNVYTESQSCAFENGFQMVQVSKVMNGCTTTTQGLLNSPMYRFVNVSNSTVYSIKENCSDSQCTNCAFETPPGFAGPIGYDHCIPFGRRNDSATGFRANHPFEYVSAMLYMATAPCMGTTVQPKHRIRRTPTVGRATSIYTTIFPEKEKCSKAGVPATLVWFDNITSASPCQVMPVGSLPGSLEYYSIHTDGKKIAGKFLCNASCMSCAVAFNGSLGECLTTSDNRSLVVNDVAAVQTCGAAATSTTSSPDPGASTDHGQAWTATVIGSTLGAFAVVWLVASAVFCRGTPPEATQTLQGDPGTQSSVSYGALKNS